MPARVHRVAPFRIARYPITYRQYRAFVEDDGGYRDPRWWVDLEREKAPGEQYRPAGNHPADNVSWHDAMAFCRWLGARLGYVVRLPAESEWQQAATSGHAKWAYPWGAEWIEGRADSDESRLGRSIAVGMYPAGASEQGVFDLAGNVWEWCLDDYGNPGRPQSQEGSDVRRALRGGSWFNDRLDARAASRYHNDPGDRLSVIGFRVVCASPITDSLNPDPLNTGSPVSIKPSTGRRGSSGSARG